MYKIVLENIWGPTDWVPYFLNGPFLAQADVAVGHLMSWSLILVGRRLNHGMILPGPVMSYKSPQKTIYYEQQKYVLTSGIKLHVAAVCFPASS